MERISLAQFEDMFRSCTRAFHLELRDVYRVEGERVPFERWLNGEPDDFAWHNDWLSFMKGVTTSAVTVQRVRVVTEPHTDYIRWEMALDPQNLEVGEDIRYLPRHRAEDITFPAEDCWLFDDNRLVLSLFTPEGGSGGFAKEPDPGLVAQYRDVRDQVWPRAIPYAEYVAR